MEKPEREAAFRATARNGAKFAKVMQVVTAKAKAVEARKTGRVKEKFDRIISFLRM